MLPMDFSLVTERCILRIPSERDIPLVFSATQSPGFNEGMVWEPPASVEELREPHRNNLEAWEHGSAFSFSIYLKLSEEFIGRISIRKTTTPGVWNIGFWTHPTQQGQGFMSEAAASVVNLGFEKLNASRIEACHALWNVGSQKVLERTGMKFVRYLPQGFQKRGEWVPENELAIDRDSWLNSKQST